MGWNDHIDDDDELDNLPTHARGNPFDVDGPFDPDDHWLKNASEEHQLIAMRAWFKARYCDPAHETPYNGREGGYLFIHGGPYNPADELHERFGRFVDGDTIQEVVDELVAEVGEQWAPIRVEFAPDDYDERYDFEPVQATEPLDRLQARIEELKTTLALQTDATAKELVARLVFSALIGALESFLWETAQHWIEEREDVLRRCVEKLPVFKERPLKLGEVFLQHEKIKETVKGHLQNLVWHRWDQVGALYKTGLGVKFPSVAAFEAPLIQRHHIVHRSGTDMEGKLIHIGDADVTELAEKVEAFAAKVAEACLEKFIFEERKPSPADASGDLF